MSIPPLSAHIATCTSSDCLVCEELAGKPDALTAVREILHDYAIGARGAVSALVAIEAIVTPGAPS